MITTIHARPSVHAVLRGMVSRKLVLCPRCSKSVGSAAGPRETREMLLSHRCLAPVPDMLQPSTAVPFS